MKIKRILNAFGQGTTAFTCQGRLTDGANPANGYYDLEFTLYGTAGGTNAVAGPIPNTAVATWPPQAPGRAAELRPRQPTNLQRSLKGPDMKTQPRLFLATVGCAMSAILMLAASAHANSLTWTGGSTLNSYWNTSANWGGAGVPADGDSLTFPAGSARLTNTNNLANLRLASLTFGLGGTNYLLRGEAITLSNGIAALYTSGSNTINLAAITNAAAQAIDCISGGASLCINSDLNLGSYVLSVNALGVVDLGGVISGTGGIAKYYLGVLRFTEYQPGMFVVPRPNTYTGTTYVLHGRLELRKTHWQAMHTYGDTAVPGALSIGTGPGPDVVQLFWDDQISDSSPVALYPGGKLDLNGFNDTIGSLSMAGGIVANTGTGTLALQGGVTATSASGTYPTAEINGRLDLSGVVRPFVIADGPSPSDLLVHGEVLNGGIWKLGGGTMSLLASNSYADVTLVGEGTLVVDDNNALGTSASGTIVSNTAAALHLDAGAAHVVELLWLMGSGPSGSGALVADGSVSWDSNVELQTDSTINCLTNASLTINGRISGVGGFTKLGPGTLVLAGSDDNTYLGDTLVNEGVLELSAAAPSAVDAIPGTLIVGDGLGGPDADVVRILGFHYIKYTAAVTVNPSGLLDVSHSVTGQAIGSLAGNGRVELGSQTLAVGANSASTTFGGSLTGPDGAFLKQGFGTLTLTGNSPFSGITGVELGTLLVNGSQPSSRVRVDRLGTLGGTGMVGDIVGTEGTVAPGASSGVLTSSNVTFRAAMAFAVELNGRNPGSGYDQLNVRGTNDLAGAALNLSVGFSPTEGDAFTILNNDGADPVTGTFAGLPEGAIVIAGNCQFRITYQGGDGNDVVLTFANPVLQLADTKALTGNLNGTLDLDECNLLFLTLTNMADENLTGVSATLVPQTPGVAVTASESPYGTITAHAKGTNSIPFQISTLPGLPCGTTLEFALVLVTADHGTLTLPVLLPTGYSAGFSQFSSHMGFGIPDVGSAFSMVSVAGMTVPLAEVAVAVFITHTYDSDLTLSLVGPDGTAVPLSVRNGGSGDNYGTACGAATWTSFDDHALTSIAAGMAPFVGSFRPQRSLSAFRGKTGVAVNGGWTLVVTDSASGNTGTLDCWSLYLYPATCSSGGGMCESCPDRTIRGILSPLSRLQNGYVEPGSGTPGTCGGLQVHPQFHAFPTRYADAYTFVNGESNACITVTLTSDDPTFSVAYRDAYNPVSISQNYLANVGYAVANGVPRSYAFNVAAGGRFVVVVNALGSVTAAPYALEVTGGSCRPALAIGRLPGNNVRVDWTTAAVGYHLESTHRLTGSAQPVWTAVVNEPRVVNSRYTITNALGGSDTFYRLHKPGRTNEQGTVVFNNRIEVTIPQSITHVWGPSQDSPCLSLLGLGTNDIPSGTSPFGTGRMVLIGTGGREGHFGWDTTFAQLLGAVGLYQPESTLVPVGQTTTFRGDALGNLVEITNRLTGNPGIPKDAAAATFEIVAWDNSSGLYPTWVEACPAWLKGLIAAGHSASFYTTTIGGDINPTPYLNNGQDTWGLTSFNLYFLFDAADIGLRAYDGNEVVRIGCEPPGQSGTLPSSPLRIAKTGTAYGINLVETNAWDASKIQIQTPSGIKALMKRP